MTSTQAALLAILLAVCFLGLVWLLVGAHQPKSNDPGKNLSDRATILEMLTKVSDQASLSVYKKVYSIQDNEITEKSKALKAGKNETLV